MANYLFIASMALSSLAISQTNFNFTISGNLQNVADGKAIYIHHKWDGKNLTDSAKVKGGAFSFKGKSSEPNMY